MKSIDLRRKYFLLLYPSLSRLAIRIERIAVKVEIVGSSLTTYNIFFYFFFYFLLLIMTCTIFTNLRVKVNVIEFILKH